MPQAIRPASAPPRMPAAICIGQGSRASSIFRLHAATSHSSVAGKTPPVTSAARVSHSQALPVANIRPAAVTASTYSTARSTTPA